MIKSVFRAYDNSGIIIYRATVTGETFDEHDNRIDQLIAHSLRMGASRFEVIGK